MFALANAGLTLKGLDVGAAVSHPLTLGVALGLVVGKPVGIFLFAFLSVRLFRTPLTQGITWRQIVGVSFLGGIGFTMSLFIAGLSFSDPALVDYAKLGVILASVVAASAGYFLLAFQPADRRKNDRM